jgi:hypothetical protein
MRPEDRADADVTPAPVSSGRFGGAVAPRRIKDGAGEARLPLSFRLGWDARPQAPSMITPQMPVTYLTANIGIFANGHKDSRLVLAG